MAKSRLQIAKRDIEAHFSSLPQGVFSQSDIRIVLDENRSAWRLTQSLTLGKFIDFLLHMSKLKRTILHFPSRKETRFTWGVVTPYAIAQSLRSKSYFTHFTAVLIHGLTMQVPKTIYVNSEQRPKYIQNRSLEQSRIDRAFRSSPRMSKTIAKLGDNRVCLLNGMYTDSLGMIESIAPDGTPASVTGVERTLIDIAVRPFYAGGVSQVLSAYREAAPRVSVNKMCAFLKKLDYVYPYHQAIGFYLEKSRAYSPDAVQLMHQFEMEYDFYLTHKMTEIDYSEKWRLYYPKGL